MTLLGLDFPPISHVTRWPDILFDGTPLGINKTVLIYFASVLITLIFFFYAARRHELIPRGIQNMAESSVDFIREGIILQTIGPDGMAYLPFLTTMFFFIFFINIFEIVPFIQFPGNARIAVPFLLALLVWFMFNRGSVTTSRAPLFRPMCRSRSCRCWCSSSSSRCSWCGPSRWPSGCSPTCSPATSSW